ncbi:MAG: hypothetical protein AB1782_18530 [Cyanobacteriota bacterium]
MVVNFTSQQVNYNNATIKKNRTSPLKTNKSNQISFKGNETDSKPNSFWTGFSSFIIPGLGQAINGQIGKALGYFCAELFGVLVLSNISRPLGFFGSLAISIFAANDAYKNSAKKQGAVVQNNNPNVVMTPEVQNSVIVNNRPNVDFNAYLTTLHSQWHVNNSRSSGN